PSHPGHGAGPAGPDANLPLSLSVRARGGRVRRAAAASPVRGQRSHRRLSGAAVSTLAVHPGAPRAPAPTTGTLVDVRGLGKGFPVRGPRRWLHAVDDVSFTIERGECVGLVGESGCGKSTLVRLLTRLLDPTAGRVVFDGREIGAVPARSFAGE